MNETIVAVRMCPICNCNQVQRLHNQQFVLPANHPLRDGYDVVACEKCGFIYADTSATQRDYDEFYARLSKYDDAKIATGGGLSPGDAKRLKATAQQIADLTQTQTQKSLSELSVLDVGCATGGLLHFLREAGFGKVLGLDPSPHSATFARAQYDIEILTGGFFDSPLIEAHDVIVCSHVLEHVRDLTQAARALKSWLKPNGLLYIEVPDAARYGDYLVAPFQDFNTEHINHFDLRALNALMKAQDLGCVQWGRKEIESAPGVPYPALWGVWSDNSTNSIDAIEETGLYNAIGNYIAVSSQMLGYFDRRLKQRLPFGEPVIVWGTGQLTMKLLGQTCLRNAQICAFIDGNPIHHGETWAGVQVLAPTQIERLNVQFGTPPILIASTIHQRMIRERIREEMKLPNKILTLLIEAKGSTIE